VTTVFVDECGYTGEDLLDGAQPMFVIATHAFTEEQARELKARFFSKVAMPELKHSVLQRRSVNQAAVLGFLESTLAAQGAARLALAHKRYALTAKVVDWIVEPGMYRDGLDLYKDGGNIGLANLFFAAFQVEGSGVLSELLRRFQRMLRERSDDAIDAFYWFLRLRHPASVIDETLDMVRVGAAKLTRADIRNVPKGALDLSLAAALITVYSWRRAGLVPQEIIHDASTNMARQKPTWDAILAPSAPAALVGNGTFAVEFPIGVTSTEFKDSRESDALQLADVIAGAVARWARWLDSGESKSDAYGTALNAIVAPKVEGLFAWLMWPSREVARRPASPPGMTDPLKYLSERAGALSGS
jgi:hypothetical protein